MKIRNKFIKKYVIVVSIFTLVFIFEYTIGNTDYYPVDYFYYKSTKSLLTELNTAVALYKENYKIALNKEHWFKEIKDAQLLTFDLYENHIKEDIIYDMWDSPIQCVINKEGDLLFYSFGKNKINDNMEKDDISLDRDASKYYPSYDRVKAAIQWIVPLFLIITAFIIILFV